MNATCESIAVASKQLTSLRGWLADHGIETVDEAVLTALVAQFPDIAEARIRKLLRRAGVALSPTVEGVRQDNFEHLARTLIALQQAYEQSPPPAQRRIRNLVITAKDHARLASRRRPEKAQMVEWMLVWLENPPVFETWWRVKTRAETPASTDTEEPSGTW